MSRPLRIEYSGAWYHVMNRGRRGEDVYTERNDYRLFIDLLQEASELFNIKIAAYCLMPNHYHLLIHTPDAKKRDWLYKDFPLSLFADNKKDSRREFKKFRNRVNDLSQKLVNSQSET